MRGLTYRNTKTTLPGWVNTVHIEQSRGYAYETSTHFVHFYGRNTGLYTISIGLTALEKKTGTLEDWVIKTFGAEDIVELQNEVGHSIQGVWRPSLYYYADTYQALGVNETEMRLSENSLRLLVQKLDELFLYIEPSASSLKTYSHKTRELLILACTEVENFWQYNMKRSAHNPLNKRNYTTKDYVLLVSKLHLSSYCFKLRSYADIPVIVPFENWTGLAPTVSLDWYDAYNKTKHDREKHFSDATLDNCIKAVVANLVLHVVRYSPHPMFEQTNSFSTLINQHFAAELILVDPSSFYIPLIDIPTGTREDLFVLNSRDAGWTKPFIVNPLKL